MASNAWPAFFRHLRRVALRHGDVRSSGVERRPDHFPIGEECGQLGIGKRVRRESLEQRRHRCETAVERDAKAVLADEIAGEPPVRGRLRMADRLDRELVLRIPLGSGAMQLRDGIGLGAPQLKAKKIGEQLVIAEPGPLRVDGEDERIGILELEQDPFRACRSEEPIGERSVHALEDRGSKEEPANGLGLALQDLGEQVVRHGPLAPGEFGDEALWVGLAREREHREPESRRPSLRPGLERANGAVRESDSGHGEQLAGLVELEAKVGRPHLGELARETVSVEPERRIVAGREDHTDLRRPAGKQKLQLCKRSRLEQLVQVVDDEQDGLVEQTRPGRDARDDGFAVDRGRWTEILDRLRHAGDAAQRLDDRQPEVLPIALVAFDGHPGGSLAQTGGLDPRPEQDCLAAARRSRDESDAARETRRKQLEECRPLHHRMRTNG